VRGEGHAAEVEHVVDGVLTVAVEAVRGIAVEADASTWPTGVDSSAPTSTSTPSR
jgi:hypothetical protein